MITKITKKPRITRKKIIEMVEAALEPHQPRDYRIRVVDQKRAVERQGKTWYVVVEPSRENVRSYDFGARIAEAGADLMDQRGMLIQLTTVLPGFFGR